jgi:hypothetical protein
LFTDAPAVDEEFHVPPVLTKTWFHTGAFVDRERISKQFAKEYYAGDAQAPQLPDGVVPNGLSVKDIREACRALKGQTLRQEVYALDGTLQESRPYKVTEVCPAIMEPDTALDGDEVCCAAGECRFSPASRKTSQRDGAYEKTCRQRSVWHTQTDGAPDPDPSGMSFSTCFGALGDGFHASLVPLLDSVR